MRRFTTRSARQSILLFLCLCVFCFTIHATDLPLGYIEEDPAEYAQEANFTSEDDYYDEDGTYGDDSSYEGYNDEYEEDTPESEETELDSASETETLQENGEATDNTNSPIASLPEFINAVIAPIQLRINQKDIDGSRALYPLLFYNNITYIPLTYNLCRALGLESTYDAVYGLKISPDMSIPLEKLQQDLLPEEAKDQSLGEPAPSTRVVRAVYLAGQEIDNSKQEYPLILFRDITYLPLTWNFIHDILHIDYVFTNNPEQKLLELVRPIPYSSIPDRQLPQILLASRTKVTGTPLSVTTMVYEGNRLVERSIERYQPSTRLVWQSIYDVVYNTETHLLSISPQQYVSQAAYGTVPNVATSTYATGTSNVTSSTYKEESMAVTSVTYATSPDSVTPVVYEEDINSAVTSSTYEPISPGITPIVYEEIIVAAPSASTSDTPSPSATSTTYDSSSNATSSAYGSSSGATSSTYATTSPNVTNSSYGSSSNITTSTYGNTVPSTTNVVYTSENGQLWLRSTTSATYLPQPPVVPQFELITPVEGWKVQCEDSLWFFELDHMTLTPGKNGQSLISLYTYRFDIGTWSLIRVTRFDYAAIDGVIQTTSAQKRTVIDLEYGDIVEVPLP